jgi:hypothetical protein
MGARVDTINDLPEAFREQGNNPALLAELVPEKKANKYHNKPAFSVDRIFQSGREANRYGELLLMLKAKAITNLQCQVPFDISPPGHHGRKIIYICDFLYLALPSFQAVLEDSKGVKTQTYLLKKKLFESKYYPMKITEV